MESVLYGFQVNDATWFYLSFLLILAVFFRFGRLWSLRNLDLGLLLFTSPGLLLQRSGHPLGDVWLFVAAGLFLIRLFADGLLARRPKVEPNLNSHGMAFLGVSTFAFLMTIVVTSPPPDSTVATVRRADQLLHMRDDASQPASSDAGPATSLLAAPVVPLSSVVARERPNEPADSRIIEIVAARIMVILSHAAVLAGLLCIGRMHFSDSSAGLAMATLYLLLPCTAYDAGRVNHVLPAALIVWAFVAYRRPMVAGSLLGLACGTLFFPVFLLPLWAAYYGRARAIRFGAALGIVAAVLLGSLALTSADSHSFTRQTLGSIDWTLLEFREAAPAGFWSLYDQAYRIPVIAAFAIMVVVLTVWPRTKSLENLMAHSAAIIVGTQFWYPQQGGVYLLWYLPALLIVAFRPKLAHAAPVAKPSEQTGGESVPGATPVPLRRASALTGAGSRSLFR